MAEIYSSAWWLERLNRKLDERQFRLALFRDYYDGRHRVTFQTEKTKSEFGAILKDLAVNFSQLVVDAEAERLRVDAVRMGGPEDDDADREAGRIWRANLLNARAATAHSQALIAGVSYALVWNNPLRRDTPLIRVEDPMRVIVEYDDGDVDARRAGLKRWVGIDGHEMATLYLPDRVEKYRSRNPTSMPELGVTTRSEGYWEQRRVQDEPWPLPNPLDVVPLVPFINNPTVAGEGHSELVSVVPIQDAINKLVRDMLLASEYVAYPQRWATGVEIPRDPLTREPIEPFKAGPHRLWATEQGEGVNFGQFAQGDLSPYVKAVEMLIQSLASITKTPPHYLLGQSGQFPSGESLTATEAGLVAKVERQQGHFGESWEEVMTLAFKVLGRTVDPDQAEVRWSPPERRAPAQYADALGKLRAALEIPREIGWEKAGYTQTEIARMHILRQAEKVEQETVSFAAEDVANAVGAYIRVGFEPTAVLRALGLPQMRHLGLPPVTLQTNPQNLEAVEALE